MATCRSTIKIIKSILLLLAIEFYYKRYNKLYKKYSKKSDKFKNKIEILYHKYNIENDCYYKNRTEELENA